MDNKADREDVARLSKIVVDMESSSVSLRGESYVNVTFYRQSMRCEEEERRQLAATRQAKTEVERTVRTEIEKYMRTELDVHINTLLEHKETEWKEERQEELAIKANLVELHQVRKETTELASRILSYSKELHDLQASLPRRVEALLQANEGGNIGVVSSKDRIDLHSRAVLEQLREELEEIKTKMKKKLDRSEWQEVVKSWDFSTMPGSKYVTKEELAELMKQKVSFTEFMNGLSLKMDKSDLPPIRSSLDPKNSPNQELKYACSLSSIAFMLMLVIVQSLGRTCSGTNGTSSSRQSGR